jgi:glycerone phosphate O-acyltransferase
MEQLKKIRELAKHDSVVFVPSHRSYMDFLLVSLLCFDQEIPLPAICAGSDFQSSYLLGEALRKCGAFFIKRSFGEVSLPYSFQRSTLKLMFRMLSIGQYSTNMFKRI